MQARRVSDPRPALDGGTDGLDFAAQPGERVTMDAPEQPAFAPLEIVSGAEAL